MSDTATMLLLLMIAVFSIAVNIAFCVLYFRLQNQRDSRRRRIEHRRAVRLKKDTESKVLQMLSDARSQFLEMTERVESEVKTELQRQDDRLESVAKVVYEMKNPGEVVKNRIHYLSREERERRYIEKQGLDKTTAKVG